MKIYSVKFIRYSRTAIMAGYQIVRVASSMVEQSAAGGLVPGYFLIFGCVAQW